MKKSKKSQRFGEVQGEVLNGIRHHRSATASKREVCSEELGSYYVGTTKCTVLKVGAHFKLTRRIIEVLSENEWLPLDALSVPADDLRSQWRKEQLVKEITAGTDYKNLLNSKLRGEFRARVVTEPISYTSAMHLVADGVLFPTIQAVIPACMGQDLMVQVTMHYHNGLKKSTGRERLHLISAQAAVAFPIRDCIHPRQGEGLA